MEGNAAPCSDSGTLLMLVVSETKFSCCLQPAVKSLSHGMSSTWDLPGQTKCYLFLKAQLNVISSIKPGWSLVSIAHFNFVSPVLHWPLSVLHGRESATRLYPLNGSFWGNCTHLSQLHMPHRGRCFINAIEFNCCLYYLHTCRVL